MRVAGTEERVAVDLVPDAAPGDVLLCHAGIALERQWNSRPAGRARSAVKYVDEYRSAELARGLAVGDRGARDARGDLAR